MRRFSIWFCCITLFTSNAYSAQRSINEVLAQEGLGITWDKVLKTVGIQRCDLKFDGRSPYLIGYVSGKESGVVADAGERHLFEITFNDVPYQKSSTHQVTLRFSFDRVIEAGKPFCGFELFVKSSKSIQTPTGFALDFSGNLLDEVPKFLAFDKSANKLTDFKNKAVKTGAGCYSCHSKVSVEFGIAGAEEFWSPGLNSAPERLFSVALLKEPDPAATPKKPEPKELKVYDVNPNNTSEILIGRENFRYASREIALKGKLDRFKFPLVKKFILKRDCDIHMEAGSVINLTGVNDNGNPRKIRAIDRNEYFYHERFTAYEVEGFEGIRPESFALELKLKNGVTKDCRVELYAVAPRR